MDKAILVIDMPSCCDECFALDEYGDYPVCRITQEQKGYTFRTREQKMDKCPLQPISFGKWFSAVDTHPIELLDNNIVEEIIDEYNSLGCTSLIMNSEQIKELMEHDDVRILEKMSRGEW